MNIAVTLVLALIALPAVLSCGYLLLLTLLSARNRVPAERALGARHWPEGQAQIHASGQSPEPRARLAPRRLRFDLIVPAHNEQALIERTVRNLLRIDWPIDSFRVIVVADNCTDDTAARAHLAGAHVLGRTSDERRGKGYALEFAFDESVQNGWADAIVVIDADSEVSGNLLSACAARIANGAEALQIHYGVLDARSSWRTRLMCIALASFHQVRSRARERLGISCGFRGNGWCITHGLLAKAPYRAYSLAEDVEYGIDLGLAGIRIHYVDEARVDAEMVADGASARTQRRRWEHGRFELIRSRTRALLQKRSAVSLDLALDLLVLPLSYIGMNVVALAVIAAVLLPLTSVALPWLWVAAACGASLMLYVLRGWQLSGMGALGLVDLARAPVFVIWKVLAMLQPRESVWIRTRRRTS
jgi:cellulose synthase/poly-beta-1,6-N-acetylglucosamine synthase-like glycosyltransferase